MFVLQIIEHSKSRLNHVLLVSVCITCAHLADGIIYLHVNTCVVSYSMNNVSLNLIKINNYINGNIITSWLGTGINYFCFFR